MIQKARHMVKIDIVPSAAQIRGITVAIASVPRSVPMAVVLPVFSPGERYVDPVL